MKGLVLVSDAFGGRGGIAKFNRDFVTALCSFAGIEEILCLPRLVVSGLEPLPAKLVYRMESVNSKLKFMREILRLVLGKKKFDFLICGHIRLMPAAYFLHLIFKIPLYLIVHGLEAWQAPFSLWTVFFSKSIQNFISVSEYTRGLFSKWSGIDPSKCFLLPNSVDLERFQPGPKPKRLVAKYHLKGKYVLLTVGRLAGNERLKGFDQVIEALPKLSEKIPGIVYIVAGDGDDRGRLEKKAHMCGVADRVIFSGYLDEELKPDYYRLADLYVMPSQGEGFGIVYLEALASGLTIVGSSADASQETLKQGQWGYLVNPLDPKSIEQGILRAFQQPIRISRRELEEYSGRNFIRRSHKIMGAVLGRRDLVTEQKKSRN